MSDDSSTPPEEPELEKRVEEIMGSKPPVEMAPAATPPKKITVKTAEDSDDLESTPEPLVVERPKTKPNDNSDSLLAQIGATTDSGPVPSPISESMASEPETPKALTPKKEEAPKPVEADSEATVKRSERSEKNAVTPFDNAADPETYAPVVMHDRWYSKITGIFKHGRIWLLVLLVITGLMAWPMTRYRLLGYILKEPVSVSVIDSTANTPVTGATISMDGVSATTDGSGKATIKVPLGQGTLTVTKHYYKSFTVVHFAGLKSGPAINVKLVAAGRQVPIIVINKFTGQPLANVQINVLGTSAKTGQNGTTTVVLPAVPVKVTASFTLTGYNTLKNSIQVTNSVVSANTIGMIPAGSVYFLSNLSGTMDVVKTNLDGSNRQTILAGTGKETTATTNLLASQDWRFLLLSAQRSGNQPSLYLIDTASGKLTNIDTTDAAFTLVGWYDHDFIYDEVSSSVPAWQSGHEQLKSYNADTGQVSVLDQNQAEGASSAYVAQSFNSIYIIGGQIVYDTNWTVYSSSGATISLGSANDTIRTISTTGQNKKDWESVLAAQVSGIRAVLNAPNSVYYAFYGTSGGAVSYYQYQNQAVSSPNTLTAETFSQNYPSYLIAPSNTQSLWSQPADGKNALLIGDQTGAKGTTLSAPADYLPYGWYSDKYLIVSKNSELYIMPVSGLKNGVQPFFMSDYFQPVQLLANAQYSYGGL